MSIKIQNLCWPLDLPPTQKLVLICLSDFADDNGKCYPSAMLISKLTGLSESATRRAIAELEKSGQISRSFQTGRPTFYTIHPCQSDTPVIATPLSEKQLTPVTVTSTPVREATDPCQKSKYNHQEPSLTIIEPSISKSQSLTHKKPVIDCDYLVNAFQVDRQIALDWLAVRKHKKAPPLSETALRMLVNESGKAGITPAQAIAQAAGSGWISFKSTYGAVVAANLNGAASAAGVGQW